MYEKKLSNLESGQGAQRAGDCHGKLQGKLASPTKNGDEHHLPGRRRGILLRWLASCPQGSRITSTVGALRRVTSRAKHGQTRHGGMIQRAGRFACELEPNSGQG